MILQRRSIAICVALAACCALTFGTIRPDANVLANAGPLVEERVTDSSATPVLSLGVSSGPDGGSTGSPNTPFPLPASPSVVVANTVSPSSALWQFEQQCMRALPQLFSAERRLAQRLFSPFGKEWLLYEPRTVCITRSLNIFRYSSNEAGALGNRPFKQVIAGNKNTRVDYLAPEAMFNGNHSLLLEQLARDMKEGALQWHTSLALVMASRLDSHPHHFIMDEALQALGFLRSDATVANSTYEPVRVSDAVLNVVRKDDADRPLWPVTRQLIPPIMMMPRYAGTTSRLVSFDTHGSDDGKTHCYCQGVLLHGSYQRERRRYEKHRYCERRANDVGCQLFREIRVRLLEAFNLVPFGTTPPLSTFQSLGFWPSVRNTSVPRLLIGLRHERVLHDVEAVEQFAVSIGFAVQRIVFDQHSPVEQFIAMRSADVFLAIHGAALTWLMFLDTLGGNSFCRSIIELMVSIPERYLSFYIQQSTLANVSFFRIPMLHVELINITAKEKARLERLAIFRNPFVIMTKNQSLSYDMEKVKTALQAAYNLRGTCAT